MSRHSANRSTGVSRTRARWRIVLLAGAALWLAASYDDPARDPFTISASAR